ncbi:MAG: signal peptidase II, partial [Oscillospiraceae bacterium]|nr:signal peptidase II [Oscillospiraceae bacterium]
MIYFILAAIIVLGDQVFKYWICANLVIDGTKELLPGIVHLTHIENTGAAFSMLSGMRWVLVGVSVFAAIVLIAAIIKTRMGALARISLAFILGGAVGNLVDRVLFGSVVDMFVVDIVKFNGIFNIADIFVVIG